jgi:hypothetical protein
MFLLYTCEDKKALNFREPGVQKVSKAVKTFDNTCTKVCESSKEHFYFPLANFIWVIANTKHANMSKKHSENARFVLSLSGFCTRYI